MLKDIGDVSGPTLAFFSTNLTVLSFCLGMAVTKEKAVKEEEKKKKTSSGGEFEESPDALLIPVGGVLDAGDDIEIDREM